MKVIFLDIDGVLNVIGQGYDEYGQLFHKHFEDNLKWIIEQTNAKIVISSTWRMSGLKIMREMWEKRGLAGDVIDITTISYNNNHNRGHEIQQWIDDNNVTSYCIIDDDDDMLPSQLNNFVRTADNQDHPDSIDIGYGLTRKCAEQVVTILNRKNG
jgi:hypothetical protein